VKRLWDEDTSRHVPLLVVVLGSAPLLLQRGLSEGMAGRFETLHVPHRSLPEMRDAFGWDLERFLLFGGYPGAAPLVADMARWRTCILDSLVETAISRDVLLMTRVDKPALLRQPYHLAVASSGQILSYTRMLGQLQGAGNTTTLAHYLDLLTGAGLATELQKYAGTLARQRASSPRLQVFTTALMTVSLPDPREWLAEPALRGQLTESAVGGHSCGALPRKAGS
jgi:predicted AAA+ superfamily ATPase